MFVMMKKFVFAKEKITPVDRRKDVQRERGNTNLMQRVGFGN
jgi:hypothetical protein